MPLKKLNFLLLFSVLMVACKQQAPTEEEAVDSSSIETPVTVATITKASMEQYVELNAIATFLQKSYIKATANGYLLVNKVAPGQSIRRGQLLFTIKTKEAESIGNVINRLDSSFKFSGTNSLRAGESGFITELNHQAGDYVQDGEQLAVISNESSFAFLMSMPYELRPYIMSQKTVELTLPDGEKLQGNIESAMPQVDSIAQTQNVIIRVHATHTIPQNLVAKVKVVKKLDSGAVSLPKSAVLTDETQQEFWVMKLINAHTAVKVPVTKGIETDGKVEILSPTFSAEDKIVVTGNYGLEDTAKVKIIQQQ